MWVLRKVLTPLSPVEAHGAAALEDGQDEEQQRVPGVDGQRQVAPRIDTDRHRLRQAGSFGARAIFGGLHDLDDSRLCHRSAALCPLPDTGRRNAAVSPADS